MIDHLERARSIRRHRHPVDRRAVILEPGEKATDDARESLDVEKRRVNGAADEPTDAGTATITRFLRSTEQAVSEAVGSERRADSH